MGKSTKRKAVIRLDESKAKQQQQSGASASGTKKGKKAQPKDQGTDIFDPKTGTVFSTRPEDTDQQLVEANIKKFLQNLGELGERPTASSFPSGDPSLLTSSSSSSSSLQPPQQSTTSSGKTMEGAATSGGSTKSSSETPVTFWQEVTDPKTKHCYYWNPTTNEVNWSLPPNAVISNPSDSTDKLAVLDSNGEPGASELSGYYEYYSKNWYGVDPEVLREQQRAAQATTEDSKEASDAADAGSAQKKQGEPGAEEASKGKGEGKKGGLPAADGGTARPKPSQDSVGKDSSGVGESGVKTGSRKTDDGAKQLTGSSPRTGGKQESQILRLQLSSLSDELTRKLKYLQVSQEKVPDLQLLSVQLETRLTDWREGGLNSKYLLTKLKEMAEEVHQYVESSAPSGWSCEWDSATCRYFFNNKITGEISWEFPNASPPTPRSLAEEEEEEGEEELDTTLTAEKDEVEEVEMDIQTSSPESEAISSVQATATLPSMPPALARPPPPPPPPLPPPQSLAEQERSQEELPPLPPSPSPPYMEKDGGLLPPIDAQAAILPSTPDSGNVRDPLPEEPAEKPSFEPTLTFSTTFAQPLPPSLPLNESTPESLPEKVSPMFPYQPLSETSTPLGASPPDSSAMKPEGQEEEVVGGPALTGQTEYELRERLLRKKMAEVDKSLDSQTGQAVPGPHSAGVTPSQDVSRDGEPDREEGEVAEMGVEESPQKSSKRPREEPTDRSPTGSKRSSSKGKRSKRHRDDRSDQSDSDDDRDYSRRRSLGRRHQPRSNSDRYSDYSDGSDNKGQSSSRRRGGDSRYSDSDHSDDNHHSYRDYHRSRSHRHYHSDDYSDDDRGSSKRSSRKRRSRSRSKEHRESYDSKSQRDKSNKKSKKDKKKRKHHHSSSDEEHDRSRSSGDRGKDSRDSRSSRSSTSKDTSRRSLSSREPSKPTPPQPPEKSFVPAKYKPKGKVREEPDELGNSAPLTPTQMQMLHSIASATGAYGPVSYPVMEQQYYYPTSYNTSSAGVPYDASTAAVYPVSDVKPSETAASEEEATGKGQEVHVPVLSPVAEAKIALDSAQVEEKAAVVASAEISMEAVATEEKAHEEEEEEGEKEMASDYQRAEEIAECEMEVEEESPVTEAMIADKPVEVAVEQPLPPSEEGAVESLRSPEQPLPVALPPVEMREGEKDEEANLQAYKTTLLDNLKSDIESSSSQTSEPVSAIEVVARNQTPPLVETKEEMPAPAESVPPAEVVGSSSPPAPSSMEEPKGDQPTPPAAPEVVPSEALPTSSTITTTTSQLASTAIATATSSSTPTSTTTATSTPYSAYQQAYSYAQADPNQAYAAYAQAAMAYNNPAMAAYYPYQYGTAMYDPSQYAAAMNYYANYQAAYGAYGAYYQQGANSGTGNTSMQQQKK